MRWASSILLAASAPVLAGCGPPVLLDTDLQPVRRPLVTASVDNGWLAVDSTEAGVRAVLELRLEGPPETDEYLALHIPRLHCTVSGEHIPARLLREEPICPPPGRLASCPEWAAPEECERILAESERNCLFTVRAEFMFDRMPHLDENSHFFTFAQTDAPIYWTRAERVP